ncbi:MAG: PilW family protein [Endomicrobiales bacterium]
MKKGRGNSGFSLIEVVVSLVIGTIFLVALGTMLIYTFVSWFKSRDSAEMWNDYRYSRQKMEFLARQSVGTDNFTPNAGNTSLEFNTVDRVTGQKVRNQFRISDNDIMYEWWYVGSTSHNPELMMKNADALQFLVVNPPGGKQAIQVTIRQRRTSSYTSNAVVRSSHTFLIESRN